MFKNVLGAAMGSRDYQTFLLVCKCTDEGDYLWSFGKMYRSGHYVETFFKTYDDAMKYVRRYFFE